MPWYFYDSNGNYLSQARGIQAVTDGGTGASTLTDGGVLLGSGTGAVTAMAVLADGAMIVGDGSTDPVAETGATLRTSIGVGTTDSPQFTGVNVGHASDTTIARASAGNITVEGNEIYRAQGTDVPLTDGGTGASNASGARTNLGLGTMAVVASPAPVANGGTGATSLTQNGALVGNGTSAVTAVDMSTKGGLLVGDGSGNPSVLAVGANGLALVADSGEATGLKYASAGVGLGMVIALGG